MITAEVVIVRCCCIVGFGSGFIPADRTLERRLYQTLRTQSRRIAGTEFLSALRAAGHFGKRCNRYCKFPRQVV